MFATSRLLWQQPLPSNGALNILHLWTSGGRTRETILMKFGMQQQVRTAMTVMRSNIKIFKIQNVRRPPCWKYIRNAITRLPMDRLGRKWVVTSHHVPDMSAVMRLPWQLPLPSNILQLWTSGGRTREPILMKFGKQTQIRTTMKVTYQILKVGVRSLLESIRNAIIRNLYYIQGA